ncbi:ABC transporter permease subunit [Brevundimonas sp.]|uniref:ABC transporter permease subunit n=1 Tax=Brevundimonas sp. TaxID=1871086 RepID=UPI002896F1FF|nr:ABC transporter permease subunit [Brevundimonas sp.]
MLADAIRSEAYRLTRNRTVLSWSLIFVPVIVLAAAIGGAFFDAKVERMADQLPPQMTDVNNVLDIGTTLISSAGQLANPALLAFLLIGAATVFAGDYRWETWRLITARNSRANLIMGKAGAVKLMTLTGLLLFVLAALIGAVAKGLILDRNLIFDFGGQEARDFALLFLLGYMRVIQFLLLSLLAATLTRSQLAALFVPLVVGVAQGLLVTATPILGWSPVDWQTLLLFPGAAYETLKAVILGGIPAAVLQEGVVWRAVTSLALWSFIPFGLSLWWFSRQDLSKE